MTPFPYAVGFDDPVDQAHALVGKHGVRHLPVRQGEDITGIVSDHDVLVAQVRRRLLPREISVAPELEGAAH